jgi:hypothetical protein
VIVWSVISLIALLGGIGVLFAAFGRWRMGWQGRDQATRGSPTDVGAQRASAPHRCGANGRSIGTNRIGNAYFSGARAWWDGMQTTALAPADEEQGGKQKPQPTVTWTSSPGTPAEGVMRTMPTSALADCAASTRTGTMSPTARRHRWNLGREVRM